MGTLKKIADTIGRGTEDVLTLGGTELARKFGSEGLKNSLDNAGTALGANLMAGAAGGSAILGAQALGAGGAASTAPAEAAPAAGPSSWEAHAPVSRNYSSYANPAGLGGSGYNVQPKQNQIPIPPPPMPTIKPSV